MTARPSRPAARRRQLPGATRLLPIVIALVLCALPVAGQNSGARERGPREADPNHHLRIPPALAEGQTIELIYVHLRNPTGDASKDERTRLEIEDAFGIHPGAALNLLVAEVGVKRIRALSSVRDVEYRVYSLEGGGQVAVAVLVTLQVGPPPPAPPPKGALATRKPGALPLLWEDDRSLVKLIVNPAVGVYADRHAWLGNPGAFVGVPEQESTVSVVEAGLEFGLGGIVRVGHSNAYVYGAASYIGSTTQGEDIYSTDSGRGHGEMEDLYAGLLVARKGSRRTLNISVGRQKFSLNRNLLIGHVLGASNGGDRAASNLSPRNAYDMTVDARFQVGKWTAQAWLADPNELPSSNTASRYAGLNLKFNDSRSVDVSLTALGALRSTARYPTPDGVIGTREGLRAINPRIRWNSAFGVEGLWFEGEWAHEWHADFDMSADGGGLWAGYRYRHGWNPAVLYRYAVMTGDDPATRTYERFDTLTGGVQRDWAQGMDTIKIAVNRNFRTHRIELSAKPIEGLEVSVDYYYLLADQRNNLGGQPPVRTYAASHLGQEITPTLQWMIGKSLYVQALATFMIPGEGIEAVLPEPSHVWRSYQLSLYWFF